MRSKLKQLLKKLPIRRRRRLKKRPTLDVNPCNPVAIERPHFPVKPVGLLLPLSLSLCMLGVFDTAGQSFRKRLELLKPIDHEEGVQMLSTFRQMWVVGDFSLKYSIQFIPRRGKRQEVLGTLWGSSSQEGPISLIHLHTELEERQFFLKNGPYASVMKRQTQSGEWTKIQALDWFQPIDETVTINPFDLMMPFVFWPDWEYIGVTKKGSRVAHAFLMKAPSQLTGNPLGLFGVIVYLDENFNALLRADYVNAEEDVIRSLRLLDLKKLDGVWLPKTVDVLDEITRNKTRLVIKEAAVNRNFSDNPLSRGLIPQSVPEIPIYDYKLVR